MLLPWDWLLNQILKALILGNMFLQSEALKRASAVERERDGLQAAMEQLEKSLADRDRQLQAYSTELARYQNLEMARQVQSQLSNCLQCPNVTMLSKEHKQFNIRDEARLECLNTVIMNTERSWLAFKDQQLFGLI